MWISARPSRGMVALGSTVKGITASLMMTDAMVISSGPVLRTWRSISFRFENIAFDSQGFRRCGRFETQSAASGEEERDHSSEENDWDQKQDEGPKVKRFVVG